MSTRSLVVTCVAGWMNRPIRVVIGSLREESFLAQAGTPCIPHDHQGLDNKIFQPDFPTFVSEGDVCCRIRLRCNRVERACRTYYDTLALTLGTMLVGPRSAG